MNYKKYFDAAKDNNISPFEVKRVINNKLSISFYNGEIEKYNIAEDQKLLCRGIYEGNLGFFSSDRIDSKIIPLMIESIKENATYGNEGDPSFFIDNKYKYKKVSSYSKKVEHISGEELIQFGKYITNSILREKRITVCQGSIGKIISTKEHVNSNGLKLLHKSSYMYIYVSTKVEQNGEIESYGDLAFIDDINLFDKDSFVSSIIKNSLTKLGGISVESGKYNVIFDSKLVPMLLHPLLHQLSSFDVNKHLSLFEGKLNQKVLSSKLTVKENPWVNNAFGSSFDAEGVPTQPKILFDKGVLKTYLYDLDNAKQCNTASTGNASLINGNIRPSLHFIEVKKSRKNFNELVSLTKNGIYITDLSGIGTGLNVQSCDYSLQAEGFLIENGEITKPVSLITVSGNLLKDFNKVIGLANDCNLRDGMITPSIAIENLSVSGK